MSLFSHDLPPDNPIWEVGFQCKKCVELQSLLTTRDAEIKKLESELLYERQKVKDFAEAETVNEAIIGFRDAEIERLKAKLDSVWATQYQCPPCRNGEHESHFIGEGKCACVPCFEKEYKVLDAEIERARELIRMAEKRRQCWDCDSKGGKHKIGCAVWKYLEAYVWEKPAQPKEEL